MLPLTLKALRANLARREAAVRVDSRRRRDRWAPGAESLEVRDCPSGATSSLGLSESAHALVAAQHAKTAHSDHVVPLKKVNKGALTIDAAPNGKTGATAGKNAAHPASLTVALKRAKAGTTIVLAPGTYTQNVGMNGKSGITIQGAANDSSVLAPPGGQALKIYSSSGITINDVAFRTGGSGGVGLAIVGSSVTLENVTTAGTTGNGVVIAGGATVTAMSSHFDSSQTGDGMDVSNGSVTINGCTFNNNGTARGSSGGTGLSVEGNSTASIMNSQFIGNWNTNLVAFAQSQVTAQGSTFSNSHQGDGAIFSNQTTVNLTGNTFASNGTVVGYVSGFNGVEFSGFTGTAVVSGNTFSANTANGIFIGGASQALQITGNTFVNNLVGLNMDASVAPIAAVIQGNTFTTSLGSGDQGLVAAGSGVTATIGGPGSEGNTFANFAYQRSILKYYASRGQTIGAPNLTILANMYLSGGTPVDPSQAILPCC
jgi:hypothetical protein